MSTDKSKSRKTYDNDVSYEKKSSKKSKYDVSMNLSEYFMMLT